MINRVRSLLLLLFLFPAFTAYSADTKSTMTFAVLLSEAKMMFRMPDGLVEAAVVENDQMHYYHAIKYPDKKFEVRYAVRPLGAMIDRYKEREKNNNSGEVLVDPNNLYSALFQAIAMNISGGKFQESMEFDKASVQQDFNADWGATTFVEVGKSFGMGYKYCMMIAIHKNDCADAYVFFMSDDPDHLMELATPAFYSLKFK